MGVISRRVLPACGSLCICCPELRARSRQPVKRYKKLLADVFPKAQDELPNDRKIGKLTEYASKNPLRIPKIANALEQRGYKELRAEHYGTVRVVMRAYSKLFTDCKDQMPLFAPSALSMIKALLEQVRQDDLRILGCLTLVDFLNNQTDSTYMRNVDAFLPKLCALARETGEESRRLPLRAAGLQGLASMITFMGKFSQISSGFDEIVEVILDNFEIDVADLDTESQDRGGESSQKWVQEVLKGEGRTAVSVMKGAITKLYWSKETSRFKDPANLNRKEMQLPKVWSQICVQILARLSKEVTTVRRILDPMFHYFDGGKHWSPEQGLSVAVLRDLQYFMDKSGNDQLFLPMLVRHLDHKAVADQPSLKANIVEIIGILARHSKAKRTTADIGAMSDLVRHLRKTIQVNLESLASNGYVPEDQQNLQTALEDCLTELVKRVGDSGPILDMMASNLEKLPGNAITARTKLEALSVLARCIAHVQDPSDTEQLFPESLLEQFLRAMLHPDAETRVRAHHLFALLLVPSSVNSKTDQAESTPTRPETSSVLSRTSSVFSSASTLFEKLRKESFGLREKEIQVDQGAQMERDDVRRSSTDLMEGTELKRIGSIRGGDEGGISPYLSPSRYFGFRRSLDRSVELSMRRSASHRRQTSKTLKNVEMTAVRLSGHQAALLLSVLWLQANLPDNLPSSFEAIAHTYMLILLFSRPKTSGHSTITLAFQLAFSLRNLALDSNTAGSQLPPSRRRSVFMLATAMLVFAGQAYNIPQIISPAKAPLTDVVKDPSLDLLEDLRLKVVPSVALGQAKDYGTPIDDRDALKALSCISLSPEQTAEALVALVVRNSTTLAELDDYAVTEQMLRPFTPEKVEGLGPHLYLEAPHLGDSPSDSKNSVTFDEILAFTGTSGDDDIISDQSQGDLPRLLAYVSVPSLPQQAIGVPQLLEQALQTAGQVACVSYTAAPLSYSDMASQCEASSFGSKKKISIVLRLEPDSSSMRLTLPDEHLPSRIPAKDDPHQAQFQEMPQLEHPAKDTEEPSTPLLKKNVLQEVPFSPAWLTQTTEQWQVFRLPPASPFDNFLKAACH
ncbi:unnamed protein product [Calypogeia fissa]